MPLSAISPGDPSWRKASRYVRIGRDDLRVVRTAPLIVASPLAEAHHFNQQPARNMAAEFSWNITYFFRPETSSRAGEIEENDAAGEPRNFKFTFF